MARSYRVDKNAYGTLGFTNTARKLYTSADGLFCVCFGGTGSRWHAQRRALVGGAWETVATADTKEECFAACESLSAKGSVAA